ncbi:MAG: hypothetical protein LKH76_08885 [Acetobacter fabarum]|nr:MULTISPECIES: hypothetical protein [Acetobacter]MCH4025182.1 hypothetical protein [Acetobacter fabarum]MCH4055169.1 hypothetical protein [Acetobacter fabarum]MCH4128658.1 hypothetical protein [Acetobacter fabarum]MCH4141837.1 hypothetical protein [Acetobacter fabarum]MCI1243575.1 hypothetical protein [Acetobacter fabarum]
MPFFPYYIPPRPEAWPVCAVAARPAPALRHGRRQALALALAEPFAHG